MIDIHTHALPGVDDGAVNVAMSLAILKQEVEQGVDCIVFTPHYYGKRRSPEQFLRQRNNSYEGIKEYIPDGLDVRLGAEVHFTGVNLPPFEEICSLAIVATKAILLEFPFMEKWPKALLEKLAEFIDETGYTPIVAHIERYTAVWKTPEIVNRLVKMGCLIQVNASSFLHSEYRKLVLPLMKHGLVHCIGSDCHDTEERAPVYNEAKEELEKLGYAAEFARTQELMRRVLAGEQVCVECKKPVKKFLWKYI